MTGPRVSSSSTRPLYATSESPANTPEGWIPRYHLNLFLDKPRVWEQLVDSPPAGFPLGPLFLATHVAVRDVELYAVMWWAVWVVVTVAAVVGELLTTGLFLACLAVAAAVTACVALVGPPALQVVIFCALALLLLVVARPAALRLLPVTEGAGTLPRVTPATSVATAVQAIDRKGGVIRVGAGEFWTARTLEAEQTIRPGADVEIVRMEGLTALVRPVMLHSTSHGKDDEKRADPFGLSSRELEVLELLAAGLTNAEIADRLVVSPRTVHHHVSHIFDKMGATSRVDAVRLGLDAGIIQIGQVRPRESPQEGSQEG